MKILVFLESDPVIRNFVMAGAFESIINSHEVVFVIPDKGYRRINSAVSSDSLGARLEHVSVSKNRVVMWKWLFLSDQLKPRLGKFYNDRRRVYADGLGWKWTLLLTVMSLPVINSFFKIWLKSQMRKHPCDALINLLENEKPDLILHPSTFDGCYISDLIAEGKKRNITTALIMNSWDNPSLKRSLAGIPDWVAVWGEQTKEHTHKFMHVPNDRIIKLGAAQFDIFRQPQRITRDDFCHEHNIPSNKKIILYAGSSKGEDEFSHLAHLDECIEHGDISNSTIVYRPHPWGLGGKGGDRILDYPWKNVTIETSMREYLLRSRKGIRSLYMAEYYRTHDVLSSIDVLISPMSTIILEAALHGKPVTCLLNSETTFLQDMKSLVHFDEMFNSPSILTCMHISELSAKVQYMLDASNDPSFPGRIIKEMQYFLEQPKSSYSNALLDFVEFITQKLETETPKK